jgi:hypothetical protein
VNLLGAWRLATIMLTAVSMGAALAHLLEMPAKLDYEGALWLTLLQTLYTPAFGPIAGPIETLAVFASIVLAFLVRGRRPAFFWTVLGAACVAAAHAIFWVRVEPVNATLLPLTPQTLPADWASLRDQWEYSHAARAVLQLVGLAFLVTSVLVEVPAKGSLRAA